MILNSQNDSWRYACLAHVHHWSDRQGTAAIGTVGLAGCTHKREESSLLFYIQVRAHHHDVIGQLKLL
jgi:hypothetical protein